jgi:GTP-binding protein HflX
LDNIQPHIDRDDTGNPVRVWLSAETGQGIELLHAVLAELFASSKVKKRCHLNANQGDIRAKLSAYAQILSEKIDDFGDSELVIEIDAKYLGLLSSVMTEEV